MIEDRRTTFMELAGKEAGLDADQRQLVEGLTQSVSPEQALWLGGYFTGIGARRPHAATADSADNNVPRKITVLFGTETGNAAHVARALETRIRERGRDVKLIEMIDFNVRQIGSEEDMLVVVSTYGDGDPPQPAAAFFEFIEGHRAPRLDNMRFAVLALGDSSYERFCEAGKRIDRRLEELGAVRLVARADCDIDFEECAEVWSNAAIDQFLEARVQGSKPMSTDLASGQVAPPIHGRRNPFLAPVMDNILLSGRGSTKQTRHIELSLEGSGMKYAPGDAIGIAASNDPQVVEELLELLGVSANTTIEVKGATITVQEAFSQRYEITSAAPRFLDYWAMLSDATELKALQGSDRADERHHFLQAHHIVDIVRRYPVGSVRPQGFVTGLRPLQPRLYSIASSLAAFPDEAHLTLAPVRFQMHEKPRSGVASAHLADRTDVGSKLPVYIQENPHFRMPADDLPMIMIGAGTGIAPFRAFLQDREARGARGKHWLFFGERNFRTDFLYQTDWQTWHKRGVLHDIDLAFSRDGAEKIYVQHRMRARARNIYAWLDEGAHIYLCGDAARLAPDVHDALIDIVASEGRSDRDAAEDFVRTLKSERRFQCDVY